MRGADPFERNWVEIMILTHLNDAKHPVSMQTIRMLDPARQEAIGCSIFDLEDDGLLRLRDIPGDKLLEITPHGQHTLSVILAGKSSC